MRASGKTFIAWFPILFLVTFAVAQTQQGPFKHIIIIVQENRTPDNLFGSHPAGTKCIPQPDPFEPGVDIVDGGNANINGVDVPYCSISLPLNGWDQSLHNGQGATLDPGPRLRRLRGRLYHHPDLRNWIHGWFLPRVG